MAEQPTGTRHRDDVDEDLRGGNDFAAAGVIAVIFFIVSPLTVISAFVAYLAFAWQKIRISVIFWFGLVPYILVLSIFSNFVIEEFKKSWTVTIPSMVNKQTPLLEGFIQVFLQQALLAIPIGILIGIIYSAYRWKTRPIWIQTEFKMTPKEFFIEKKNIKDIKSDKNTPRNGMTLGIGEKGKRVIQTYDESRAHTIIMGASGSGKTTTLMTRLRDSIKSGQGAIILDLKGGADIPIKAAELAERYNRKFIHWTFQGKGVPYTGPSENGPAYYDPIGRGDATRRKDLLIESREWSEQYYKIEASSYLQLLFSVLVANPLKDTSTLSDVVQLLNPRLLQERAIPLGRNPEYADVIRAIDSLNDEKMSPGKKNAIDSMGAQLGVLLHSIAGPYLQLDPASNNNINLKEAAHKGDIIVFSLDSSSYGELSSLVANLVIQDLKTLSAELRKDPAPQPFQIIIDEFQAVDSGNIIGLVNKSRDANMPVTLTTQTLGDLRAVKDNPAFLDQLIGIINSFIIHRTNAVDDAQIFAGLTGSVIRKKFSEGVTYSTGLIHRGSASGQGNIQDIEEFTIMPDEIQRLKMGEMIYVNKSPMRVERVLCIPEDRTMLEKARSSKSFTQEPEPIKQFTPEELSRSSTDLGFVTPPARTEIPSSIPKVNTLPSLNPLPAMPTPNQPYATKFPESPGEIIPKPANRDRLREIMNQDPDQLSPKIISKDDFTSTHMPRRVSTPLPTMPKAPAKKLPPLPSLPKKASLPPLPQSGKSLPLPAPKATSGKDEFDF
jgi:type IV secretory pathway TraG/TraD family ATPase VirD4